MAFGKISGCRLAAVVLSICIYLPSIPVLCIVTPNNATSPSSSASTLISTKSVPSPSSSTTTVTPIDKSAPASGIASPVYSDTLGRMMAASTFIQNIQNVSSSSSLSSSSSSSSSVSGSNPSASDNSKTEQSFTPNSGPPSGESSGMHVSSLHLPRNQGLASTSNSFVDIVKDYERYKLTKYNGPRNVPPPSLIYQGDVRSISNREPLLSPSSLQGYSNNHNNNHNMNNDKNINGINGDGFSYSFIGNGPTTIRGPHPTSSTGSVSGHSGPEDYLTWSEDEVPYNMVKGYGDSPVNSESYFPSALDYSSNYDFELLPQGSKTHSHEPVASSQTSYHSRPSSPMNHDLMGDSGFFNYHSLVTNMDENEQLPILIESYVVNYPPLSEKPVAHSLSAFTFDHRPGQSNHHHSPVHHHTHNPVESNHGRHRPMPLLNSASMTYPMLAPKPTSERVFISPYLYARPCKYDCFANPPYLSSIFQVFRLNIDH